MLQVLTQQQINSLQLTTVDSSVMYSGDLIFAMLQEFSQRCMISYNDENTLLRKWQTYNAYKLPDLQRAYDALYSEYNPINNYDMTEKSVNMRNDGDLTKTRSTDANHNSVTTSTIYDYSTTTSNDSNNIPTTKSYTTTYDNAASGRLAGYTETTGASTQRTVADDDNANKSTVTDDMHITNKEEHSTTSLAFDNNTYTADTVEAHEMQRSGNIGVTSTQQLIQSTIDLHARSLLYDYIFDFICRYSFYIGGGDFYVYS